jgi:hypothetical protein
VIEDFVHLGRSAEVFAEKITGALCRGHCDAEERLNLDGHD